MYEALFDAIVKRCQNEGWFGPEHLALLILYMIESH